MYRPKIDNYDSYISVRLTSKERAKLNQIAIDSNTMISKIVRKCLSDADLI